MRGNSVFFPWPPKQPKALARSRPQATPVPPCLHLLPPLLPLAPLSLLYQPMSMGLSWLAPPEAASLMTMPLATVSSAHGTFVFSFFSAPPMATYLHGRVRVSVRVSVRVRDSLRVSAPMWLSPQHDLLRVGRLELRPHRLGARIERRAQQLFSGGEPCEGHAQVDLAACVGVRESKMRGTGES